ncbi:DUF362 domain-containing protein, partial [bacterium]|nr:DUF362 domain-containing protein [bacterium]
MSKKSEVYFLPWDENKKIPRLIEKLSLNASIKKDTFVAIKIHFGEKGTKAYIKPQYALYFAKAVKELKGKPFFTDTNTIYRGSRSDGVSHLQTAAGHGFKPEGIGAPVIIADGITSQDYVNVEINQNHFTEVKIAGAIHNADAMICLSHTKGHLLFGYGGAIKNLGMGCAARPG